MITLKTADIFGPTLTRMREAQGWSQAELGRRSGIGASRVWRYESGYKIPDYDTMARVLAPFGATICIVPARTAATMERREQLVDVAKSWHIAQEENRNRLYAVTAELIREEIRLADQTDTPYDRIRALKAENLALRKRNAALTDAIKTSMLAMKGAVSR